MHKYGVRVQVDHRLTMSETPLGHCPIGYTPSPCFRAYPEASCLTGGLRRKAWGDKAGRKGPVHLLAVTRGVTPPRCRCLLNERMPALLACPEGFEPPTPQICTLIFLGKTR